MENGEGSRVIDHSFLEETLALKATPICVSPLDAVIQHFKKITRPRVLERILNMKFLALLKEFSLRVACRLRLKCDGTCAEIRFRLSGETDESI